MADDSDTIKAITKEDETVSALGITMCEPETPGSKKQPQEDVEYVVVPDPHADEVDLSDLRGTKAPNKAHENMSKCCNAKVFSENLDLLC